MKKLSEFTGQEHITSVLRAMVIKNKVRPQITFLGDQEVSLEIVHSFVKSLNCLKPDKGDFCGTCVSCESFKPRFDGFMANLWKLRLVTESVGLLMPKTIYVSRQSLPGFLEFRVRSAAGQVLDEDVLRLLIYIIAGKESLAVSQAREVSALYSSNDIIEKMLAVLRAVVYVSHNLEIEDQSRLETLSKLSLVLPPYKVVRASQTLWDAAARQSVIDDAVVTHTLVVLLLRVFNPELYANAENSADSPIIVVDDNNAQSLSLEEMFEIASQ